MAARYEEIAEDLRRRITDGEWPTGATLPDYQALCQHYDTSRLTLQSAVDRLQTLGLIRPHRGKGLVVRDPGPRWTVSRTGQVDRDSARGYILPFSPPPGEPWEAHEGPRLTRAAPPGDIAAHLGVPEDQELCRIRRCVGPQGQAPLVLHDVWLTLTAETDAPQAAQLPPGPGGHLDRIEQAGHGPLRWSLAETARLPTRTEARALEMPQAVPVHQVLAVGTSARSGLPLLVEASVIPADRLVTVSVLERTDRARWPVNPAAPPLP